MATLKVDIAENSQNILGDITINAPLSKVFAAHINQDQFEQWWGSGSKLQVHAFKAEDGGRFHVAEVTNDGTYEFMGSFHEVAVNERIIWTFEFLGMPERGHVALEKMEFTAIDDNSTRIHTTSTYQSVADRDGMVASGMEQGWRQSMDALERLASQS